MADLDALLLARIQFGFTISFHIIFPAITIGLASYLAVLEACWLRTQRTVFRDLYQFWLKIFAVNFGMGVVSGLVMAYQFGTNWSYFSDFAGSITGPLLAYEVLTAFFLEAGFLGVMLFGWTRVGPGLHFFATVMVAVGTLISSTWILASNSWMHTPAGYAIIDGRVIPTDWLAVIFNPSFPYRLTHMVVAAYLATALLVGASGAWHLLRGRNDPAIRTMTSMAMWMLLLVAPLQAMIGDAHGLNTLKYQPAKIAAIEGHWENTPGQGGPAHTIRLARHGAGENAVRDRGPAPRQPHPHAFVGRAVSGTQGISAGRPPQFHHRVLDVPLDGGPRPPDDPARSVVGVGCAGAAGSIRRAPCCCLRWAWDPQALSRSWPAG